MNIQNDSAAAVDYVTYFTKQLPQDLAAMAALRDELAVRQGALTAVEDAAKMREDAKQLLATTKADAQASQLAASNLVADAAAKKQVQDARQKDLDKRDADAAAAASENARILAAQVKAADVQAVALAVREATLTQAQEKLAEAQSVLASRIATFQAKVAAINA
jgi:hypothetical protein